MGTPWGRLKRRRGRLCATPVRSFICMNWDASICCATSGGWIVPVTLRSEIRAVPPRSPAPVRTLVARRHAPQTDSP